MRGKKKESTINFNIETFFIAQSKVYNQYVE